MNLRKYVFAVSFFFLAVNSFALDLNTVFENQGKAAFPDTCDMEMRTTVTLPGMPAQVVNMSVITAGDDKSVTTIKSSMMQMKMVQNGTRMKVTDLKTGKTLPAQNMSQRNPADVTKQMGAPSDYNEPKRESKKSDLWKITPKDPAKPTLYYSQSRRRVVRISVVVNGATAESSFEYCNDSCNLPGTLKKTEIKTVSPDGNVSTVSVEVLSAKKRKVLPSRMFDVE